ncbi:MAG: protein tyrosine phosphatase, partial [Candidatus Pacearchaeota archaeon]
TAGMQRSPTAAELVNSKYEGYEAKYAGVHPEAELPVSEKAIEWADKIITMEKFHREDLKEIFPKASKDKDMEILGIPDIYEKNDPELIQILKHKLNEKL